ncbi:hypothetical protein OB955_15165 [Halobacteria archaeon AArc-m2/3/4]|uniref:Uncharacterized protein n=1 Tax=Natronoglomus mannanivorans TaxID=2979990 RepID=A0AAP3E4J0_9EURY|nr:hypothetical protein [Halobacteria archaeon AArc-xg1-1]MCU4974068.1 hypothetical protein [Halobacteria archaeon AArc-m2/3/4]
MSNVQGFWRGLVIVCIVMLVVLVGSVPYLESGSATFVITQIAAIHLLIALAILGALIHYDWSPFQHRDE